MRLLGNVSLQLGLELIEVINEATMVGDLLIIDFIDSHKLS